MSVHRGDVMRHGKTRAECPRRCHRCPDLGGEVMPWCWNGTIYGDLDGCLCHLEDPPSQRRRWVASLRLHPECDHCRHER